MEMRPMVVVLMLRVGRREWVAAWDKVGCPVAKVNTELNICTLICLVFF